MTFQDIYLDVDSDILPAIVSDIYFDIYYDIQSLSWHACAHCGDSIPQFYSHQSLWVKNNH